jgi:hypothetical protein
VLRGLFGYVTDEVIAGWGKLHDEEIHGVYIHVIKINYSDKIENNKWVSH